MAKDKVLSDDDFQDHIELPDGMAKLDPEPEVEDEAGLPFQLFDDDDEEEDDGKAARSPDGGDGEDDGEEEDDDGSDAAAADAERASLVAQLADLRQQLEAKDSELSESQTESKKHIATAATVALESLGAREEALADKLAKAREDGETGEEINIQRQLGQIEHIRKSLETVKTDAEKPAERPQKREEPREQSGGIKARGELASRWQAQNSVWMNDPGKSAHVAYLAELDKQLAAEGKNPSGEAYFQELTRRMKKTFPDLGVRHLDGKAPASGQRQRGAGKGSPTAGAKQTDGTDGVKNGKVKLTADDLRIMRTLKMDTSDKNVLKEYARNKSNNTPYLR